MGLRPAWQRIERTPRHRCGQPAGSRCANSASAALGGCRGWATPLRRRQRAVRGRPHRLRGLRLGLEPVAALLTWGALGALGAFNIVGRQSEL